MDINFRLNLQLFAEAGNAVNTTGGSVNAYTGVDNTTTAMTAGMKSYYDTELLENTRDKLVFQQFGRKQSLPEHHGKTIEWRKWNTLPDADRLQEGVIPTGKLFGQTALTVEVSQYGEYVAVSDLLDLQHVDNVILGATEELSVAAAKTYEKRVRACLRTGTTVRYADGDDGTEYTSTAAMVAGAAKKPYLTPTVINKAVTDLKKLGAPAYTGNKYIAVIHPSVAMDLRESEYWVNVHSYSSAQEIFNGEIGELHGVRFVESNLAPVKIEGGKAVYECLFFGKDAYATIDPAGAGMETIIKTKEQVGGPLNQFSTIGAKFSMATCILYQDRMLRLECMSSFSDSDVTNLDTTTGSADDYSTGYNDNRQAPTYAGKTIDPYASYANGVKA